MKPLRMRTENVFIKRPKHLQRREHIHTNVFEIETFLYRQACPLPFRVSVPLRDPPLFAISNLIFNLEVKQVEVMKGAFVVEAEVKFEGRVKQVPD